MTIDKGVCKDARIVLGAVAPEPLRAKTAEEFLQGRFVDEKTAADAGKLALEGVVLLNQNAYKVEIAKTLVKRTLIN
jgi:xanthine dehydrogenase YagS FAD-binding subunit